MSSKELNAIRAEVQQSFSFLVPSGYAIGPVKQLPRKEWEITLECADHRIFLRSDRGDVILAFAPVAGRIQDRFAIQVMIYHLSAGATFIGRISENRREERNVSFERLAALVRQYRVQIVPLFGAQFGAHRPELIVAKDRYIIEFINRSALGAA